MLCLPEVFQQIMTGIKLTLKMQRTKNEFDEERRILRASRTRDMAKLVSTVLSYPPYGERKLNTVRLKSLDLFYDLCKAEGTHGIISSSSKHWTCFPSCSIYELFVYFTQHFC